MATITKEPAQGSDGKRLPRELLTRDEHLELLRHLYLARYFDVRLVKEKRRGKLKGTLYSSHNQEAIMVGTLYALRSDDWISPIHRDMPAFFMKDLKGDWNRPGRIGMSIDEVCAQVFGKSLSPGRARDNWSHIGSREKKIIHSTSMLAGTIPVAAGVAYAERMDGKDTVVVTYNGEGSTAQGVFHEAINFAAVHKLPVITIIENNQWAYGTPTHLEYSQEDFARRADGYGIPGVVVDGQNVFDVYDAMVEAIEYGRSGKGPSIIECKTFRSYGHGDHDDDRADRYRDSDQVREGRDRDPIAICKRMLLEKGYITKEIAESYMAEGKGVKEARDEDFPPDVVEYMTKGIEAALASPVPPAEEGGMWVFRNEI